MYGEVEGDAPHDDQPELESLHLPGDGPAAPRGRPVLTNTISYSGTMENFLKFNVILFFKGQTQLRMGDVGANHSSLRAMQWKCYPIFFACR